MPPCVEERMREEKGREWRRSLRELYQVLVTSKLSLLTSHTYGKEGESSGGGGAEKMAYHHEDQRLSV